MPILGNDIIASNAPVCSELNLLNSLAYHTAIHLLHNNISRLILAVRNGQKGATAKSSMLEAVPTYKGSIIIWELEMADFDSIKRFAERVSAELDRVDIFLASAGVYATTWQMTRDGYEES